MYGPIYFGHAMLGLTKSAILLWTPTLFIRTWGWEASSIGYAYGAVLLLFGPLGAIGGGWVADHFRQKGVRDSALRAIIIVAFLMAPVSVCMPLMPDGNLALLFLMALTLLLFVASCLGPVALQLVTPNQSRAQIIAFSMFLTNLIGMGLGPTVVALITDYGFGYDAALPYSMAIVGAVFAPLCGIIYLFGIRAYGAEMRALETA